MHPGSNGHRSGARNGTGIRKKRRKMRAILKEGLEAALRADPQVLENCKPKTAYGRLVCGMVLEAAKCKATPLKVLMSLVDWEPHEDDEDIVDPDEPEWDWSPEGVWQTRPEEPPASEPAEAMDGPNKRELKRRLTRLIECGQHEHAARIMDALRSGQYGDPEPISSG